MKTPIYDISPPRKNKGLLSSLIGRKLVDMIRFNNDEISYLIEVFEIDKKDFFSLCLGPILLYFEDGMVFGANSNPHENTILIWVEKNEVGDKTECLQEDDLDSKPFYAKDFGQWNAFLGQIISSVTIINQIDINNENPIIDSLPSDRGIIIEFKNGKSLIISHGLNNNTDGTTIITPEEIGPYFKRRLIYDKLGAVPNKL